MQNNNEVALKWLEEAVVQAAADGNRTIKESQVHQVLKQVGIENKTFQALEPML
jgi:histone H3/H4